MVIQDETYGLEFRYINPLYFLPFLPLESIKLAVISLLFIDIH